MERKINFKNIAFWLMIIIIIGLSIYLINYVNSESYECMKNPLVYGVKNFKVSNGAEMTCTCSVIGIDGGLMVTPNGTRIYKENFWNLE